MRGSQKRSASPGVAAVARLGSGLLRLVDRDWDGVLHGNRRVVLDLPAAATRLLQEQRIAAVAGAEFVAGALHLEHETAGLRLSGWISRPTFSRSQPDLQYFYLNGRAVRDKVITSGGLLGEIAALDDKIVHLKLADNVKVRVTRNAIAGLESDPVAAEGSQP